MLSKIKDGLFKQQPYAKGEVHAVRPTHFQASYNCLRVIRQMHQVMSTHYSRNKDKTSQRVLGHCESKMTRDWFTLSLLDSWPFVVIPTKWPAMPSAAKASLARDCSPSTVASSAEICQLVWILILQRHEPAKNASSMPLQLLSYHYTSGVLADEHEKGIHRFSSPLHISVAGETEAEPV